jgi:type IV pilus assembly protein PilW
MASDSCRPRQCGVTLVEMMVALAIGLVVVLAASTAFIGAKKLHSIDADVQAAQDALRFTRHVVQGQLRQAGYADYAPDHPGDGRGVIASHSTLPADPGSMLDLDIAGASNTVVAGTSNNFGVNDSDPKSQNDSLMVRFFGRSTASGSGEPDGTMTDCFGAEQVGPAAEPSLDDRSWSFFYVALAGDGEPELYCKYRGKNGKFSSEPLVRGVEKFKVVFGHDADGDSVPETWLDAKGIAAQAPARGIAADEWRKVVAVRVGVVVRSLRPNGDLRQLASEQYRLYPLGEEFSEIFFDPPDDGRLRSTATFTVMLRNVMRAPA